MNLEDLEEALVEILGEDFEIVTDEEGQLVVWTGLKEDEDGELVDYLSDEDVEEDMEIDPDREVLEEDED